MIVNVRFDLSDADRRRLTGSQRLATRKQVAELARRLLAEAMTTLDTLTEMLRTCRSNIRLQTESVRRG